MSRETKEHGGARSGSGRKKGFATKKTREIADRAVQEGITPLEVMLKAMRKADEEGREREAVTYANMAASYIHPRLANVNSNVTGNMSVTVVTGVPEAEEGYA